MPIKDTTSSKPAETHRWVYPSAKNENKSSQNPIPPSITSRFHDPMLSTGRQDRENQNQKAIHEH
jgi:hypothetical protein